MKKYLLAITVLMFFAFPEKIQAQTVQENTLEVNYLQRERYIYFLKKNIAEKGIIVDEKGERLAVLESLSEATLLIKNLNLEAHLKKKNANAKKIYVLTEDIEKLSRQEPLKIKYNSVNGQFSIINL